MNRLNTDFARLAAARKIVAPPMSAGSVADDRVNAERWITRFGFSEAGWPESSYVDRRSRSVVVSPEGESDGIRAEPSIFYIHGGGLVYYSTSVFTPFLRVLAAESQSTIEAFDYPKVPEHTVDEVVRYLETSVTASLTANSGQPLVIAGDSVGGLLALYVALRILPEVFSRIVMIYPVLDLLSERDSYREFGENHFLDQNTMSKFKGFLQPYFASRDFDPFLLTDLDLTRLGDPALVTAGCDVLRDEAFAWTEALSQRGVLVDHTVFPDLPHDFCLYTGKIESARVAVSDIAARSFTQKGK